MNFRKFSFRSAAFSRTVFSNRFGDVKASLKQGWGKLRAGKVSFGHLARPMTKLGVRPERISAALNVMLVLLMVGFGAYWLMRIAQVPFPSALAGRGVLFYQSGSDHAERALFGEKSFDTSRLVLRGIVIMGQEGSTNQGMALIEVDGKTAEAVSVGEMVPPGIRLEKIRPDGVIVTYQGKEISLQQTFDNASGKSQ